MIALDDLNDHIEGWRRLALENTLLRASTTRLVIAEGHRLDPTNQVGEGWIQHEIFQAIPVRCADELHAALGDRARSDGLCLGADLVDHDHFGHVVFNRLDHDEVLSLWRAHLHSSRLPDSWVRNIAIACNLVRCVDNDNALRELRREHARRFTEHRRLANSWSTHDENGAARFNMVTQDFNRAEHRSTNATGEANDAIGAIADR